MKKRSSLFSKHEKSRNSVPKAYSTWDDSFAYKTLRPEQVADLKLRVSPFLKINNHYDLQKEAFRIYYSPIKYRKSPKFVRDNPLIAYGGKGETFITQARVRTRGEARKRPLGKVIKTPTPNYSDSPYLQKESPIRRLRTNDEIMQLYQTNSSWRPFSSFDVRRSKQKAYTQHY